MTDKENPNNSESNDSALTAAEQRALTGLAKETAPPDFLEDRIVSDLKRKDLLNPTLVRKRSPLMRYITQAIAAVIIFMLGIEMGTLDPITLPDNAVTSDSRQFMLLLYETEGVIESISPEREPELMAEYAAWARSIAESGTNIDGQKLTDIGSSLFRAGEIIEVSEVSPAPGERLLAGYFAIHAESLEQALIITEQCPHLKYGGEIELREIQLSSK